MGECNSNGDEKGLSKHGGGGGGGGGGEGAHVVIISYPGQGHLLPLVDLAHQLALRGLTITFLVTPKTLPTLQPLLSLHPSSVRPLLLPFPHHPSLPAGVEHAQHLPNSFVPDIMAALTLLFDPVLNWLHQPPHPPPVAIIADAFVCHWTLPLARRTGIRNLAFSVVSSRTLAWWAHNYEAPYSELFHVCAASWRLIVNSSPILDGPCLRQVEAGFVDPAQVVSVGPLPAVRSGPVRGGPSSVPTEEVVAWLDAQPRDRSVVYIGFGSQITLTKAQVEAIAEAVEASGVRFVWSVKDPMEKDRSDYGSVPAGFEERAGEKGLVIRGWAPQVAILGHKAVGSYLTHCGWNSALEAIQAGVMLLAWPMQADHHFNAEMLVDELKVAVQVCDGIDAVPNAGELARAMAESVSGGEKLREERGRLEELQRAIGDAIREGGTSHKALDDLASELNKLDYSRHKKPGVLSHTIS